MMVGLDAQQASIAVGPAKPGSIKMWVLFLPGPSSRGGPSYQQDPLLLGIADNRTRQR